MILRDLNLKSCYETGEDDLVSDFYVPILKCARRYDRVAGYFCSSSLAVASTGIAHLIDNKVKMRLVCCQHFTPKDVASINAAITTPEKLIADGFTSDYETIEVALVKDHVRALGWMMASGLLEIKIALVKNQDGRICTTEEIDKSNIMHQKVGIVYDEALDSISFSGSNNESASGWLGNIEEFKVFKNWEPKHLEFYEPDEQKFRKFWTNTRPMVETVELPQAVRDKLIEASKDFRRESVAVNRYYASAVAPAAVQTTRRAELSLWPYQEEAVKAWEDNGHRLLIEMATGCGKTRTAIGCLDKTIKAKGRVLCVIACPQSTLSRQWEDDIKGLETSVDGTLFVDGKVQGWQSKVSTAVRKLNHRYFRNLVIFTTHSICSKQGFLDEISRASADVTTMLIADEVHGLGSGKQRRGLAESYHFRIGLSATPERWFDPSGTEIIRDYFGGKSFVFGIGQAQNTLNQINHKPFLVQFEYNPRFISLTDEELENYKSLTLRILQMSSKDDMAELMQQLLFKRADIEKAAVGKYDALASILDEIGNGLRHTIVFVSPQQIDRVMEMLGKRGIVAHRFTEREGTVPEQRFGGISEREHLISKFRAGDYQALVAIKCLDEGIDIPPAKRAIIMASSTNPREYVQRIGRVIRQSEAKDKAYIYDLIIRPDISGFGNSELVQYERRIFRKEMDRVIDLSAHAINNADVYREMCRVRDES